MTKTLKKLSAIIVSLSFLVWGTYVFMGSSPQEKLTQEPPYLNVYNWYGLIPEAILGQFEAETGIHVQYDLYDSNEMLEAKLLAGHSGYDVVFPSASPYVARQITAGVFQKLDKSQLSNLKHIDPQFIQQMNIVDPDLNYSVPYYWGTFGFAYIEEIVKERMPDAPVDSYRMIFDPEVVSKFKSCGVTLLDEPVDVYPALLAYLGIDPQSTSEEDLEKAQEQLLKIRPYLSRFLGQRFATEMVSGEVCLAQGWSGDIQVAQEQAKESNKKMTIRYVIPKEGGTLWIDAMCIPKDAPHPKNAHVFINFLLRPDVSAEITNTLLFPTTNKSALPLIREEIRNNETLYPKPETFRLLKLDKIQNSRYEEKRTRYWFLAKQGE